MGPIVAELDRLLAAVWKSSEDWELRLIAADAAEESGDVSLAKCLRWMAKNKKRAMRYTGEYCKWYNITNVSADNADPSSDLPEDLYYLMKGDTNRSLDKEYMNTQESELDLYDAWARLHGEEDRP